MKAEYNDPPAAPLLDLNECCLWSFYRAIITEFVATFLFIYVIVGTIIGQANEKNPCGGVGILGIAWCVGGMIFVLVYCTAGISGGHMNPAVTFGFLVARKLTLNRAVLYMVAQCAGAVCGAGMVRELQKTYYYRGGGGVNSLSEGYTKETALIAEILGTFVLVYTVFSATDPKSNARDSHVPVLYINLFMELFFIMHLECKNSYPAGVSCKFHFLCFLFLRNELNFTSFV